MNFDVTHNFLRRVDFMPLIYSLNTDFSTSDIERYLELFDDFIEMNTEPRRDGRH
jgi:hypothetical protein